MRGYPAQTNHSYNCFAHWNYEDYRVSIKRVILKYIEKENFCSPAGNESNSLDSAIWAIEY